MQKNSMTFVELEARAKELGEQHGKGKDTQIKFLLSIIEGAYHQAIDLTEDKHGTDVDDATKLAEIYVKAQTGATVFDAKAANQRKTISCVRTGIKLGQWPKGGPGEPLNTVNDLVNLRQNARKDPTKCKKLDDAFNSMMRYARTQIKRDSLIDGSELESFIYKPIAANKNLMEHLLAERKKWKALRDGKGPGGLHDNSGLIVQIIECIGERVKELAPKPEASDDPTEETETETPQQTAA